MKITVLSEGLSDVRWTMMVCPGGLLMTAGVVLPGCTKSIQGSSMKSSAFTSWSTSSLCRTSSVDAATLHWRQHNSVFGVKQVRNFIHGELNTTALDEQVCLQHMPKTSIHQLNTMTMVTYSTDEDQQSVTQLCFGQWHDTREFARWP